MKREPIPSESNHADIPPHPQLEIDFKEAERLARAEAERDEEEALALKLWRDPHEHYGSLSSARTAAQQQLSMKRRQQRQEERRKKEEKPN